MLKAQIHTSTCLDRSLLVSSGSVVVLGHKAASSVWIKGPQSRQSRKIRVWCSSASEAIQTLEEAITTAERFVEVKAIVTVSITVGGALSHLGINRGLDDITDLLGKTLLLELVSVELDPMTGLEKEPIAAFARRIGQEGKEVRYEAEFSAPIDFGEIGAVFVENEHHKEMFLKDIVLIGFGEDAININCQSWVHAKSNNHEKRVFFTNKSYLPFQTPDGLKALREKELETMCGDGTGERKFFERIYDYDVYNDLGDPDKSDDKVRPVLGGKKHPYPRRCRTGRPKTNKDPLSEKRSKFIYVPRDEAFSEVKELQFSAKTMKSLMHALLPSISTAMAESKKSFPLFAAIDSLFHEGVKIPNPQPEGFFQAIMPRLVKTITHSGNDLLLFEAPAIMERDKFSWFRDEEFSRQTLAGLNPLSIQLLKEFPIVSKLDPEIYGPAESKITKELIEREMKARITLEEVLEKKRLFILDYHDVLLPFVHRVREIEGTTLYGSRTIFFLTDDGTLMPLLIELTRPKLGDMPQWKGVFTHGWDATEAWLWKLAKAHVTTHDAGYHQLYNHWMRTHCCTEPYIIATNRQLSVMHPIYRLLHPHFRYTMEINALARESLIAANGIIETSFAPGKYSAELSSAAYAAFWRFDMEALPADLIRRGMAVEDPEAEHGLKLTIEDYPYANDGLLLWSAIADWVEAYVGRYYPDPELVVSDHELQAWWAEVRTVGHADKKDEPWWPELATPADLAHVLSTMIWVASGHHAAVNFGQYHYGGYFPNRPTISRVTMPVEEGRPEEEMRRFLEKPEKALLECFPSQYQATQVMAVLDVLSCHSPDEEYLGERAEAAWAEDGVVREAFERFNGRLKEIERIIDERNGDVRLKNRTGAGVVPYELLKPFSKPGVTGMGVPNSISI
ncbi:hypothetical protein QJS10_CPB22g01456 [Acorus calamus]|uniref:Lipoxygenase n=1 Tax=Acorus calamus TaxID=4465 RepID=A0AAV9BZT4_ACOCL|nr:hypothetical protein QJS10_CPB22g01456 [Acorus calamus]